MLLTEEEAKTKTCPRMTYCANEAGVAQDGQAAIYWQCRCDGSACMAWRWERVRDDEGGPDGGAAILTQTYGYCGAFGKPEGC